MISFTPVITQKQINLFTQESAVKSLTRGDVILWNGENPVKVQTLSFEEGGIFLTVKIKTKHSQDVFVSKRFEMSETITKILV